MGVTGSSWSPRRRSATTNRWPRGEVYAAFADTLDGNMLYRVAMEPGRGVNLLITEGFFYQPATSFHRTDVSHRNSACGQAMTEFSRFAARAALLLRGGRHVADIGMLYPIHALQAAYRFDEPGTQFWYGEALAPRWADFLRLSDSLTG